MDSRLENYDGMRVPSEVMFPGSVVWVLHGAVGGGMSESEQLLVWRCQLAIACLNVGGS